MRKVLGIFLSILMVTGFIQVVSSIVVPNAAYAVDPPIQFDEEYFVSQPKAESGGSGSSKGAGGSAVVNPNISSMNFNCYNGMGASIDPVSMKYPTKPQTRACVIYGNYASSAGFIDPASKIIMCPARNGVSAWNVTATYQKVTGIDGITATFYLLSYYCNYPPQPDDNTALSAVYTCYIDYDSYLYKAGDKNSIRYNGGLASLTTYGDSNPKLNLPAGGPMWNVTTSNIGDCGILYGSVNYKLNSPEEGGYGYYRIDTVPTYRLCLIRGFQPWVGDTSRDRVECSGVYSGGAWRSYAVSSCSNNFAKYGGNWAGLPDGVNFAVSACAEFTCVVNGDNTSINGTNQPTQAMRNGESLPVRYPTITIQNNPATSRPASGGWDISGGTGVVENSSPYNGSWPSQNNNSKQYFKLVDDTTGNKQNFLTSQENPASAWEPQDRVTDKLQMSWASTAGQTFKIYRTWRVNNAEFWVPTPVTTGGGGANTWQSQTIYCGYSESNPLTVLRSVNE